MKLGLHIPDFTWPSGRGRLGEDLARIAAAAENAGFDRLSVMDHLWQIAMVGPREHEMLEAYTTLGFLAAHTSRIRLLTLVTGAVYREPGLLAKAVTTLDVLSGGRAMLGIGAAWNEEEAAGLGLPFPPLRERFERLEEALEICLQMWSGKAQPFEGRHYHLGCTLNSPPALSSPHPPIIVGGSGERRTLALVARYAQGCNLFFGPELPHKLQVLRQHCEQVGRDYDDIEKTVLVRFEVGNDEQVRDLLDRLGQLSELGVTVAHGSAALISDPRTLEVMGEQVVPAAARL